MKTSRLTILLLSALSVAACQQDSNSTESESVEQALVQNYVQIAAATYDDTADSLRRLDQAIQAFVSNPSEENLATARQAWLNSREYYLQTEVFRFYEGPIDAVEGYINAWPLDEAYIDYTRDNPAAGLINRQDVTIDRALLLRMNEAGGEENVSTGYHAIEFLLWGQDFSTTGPGERPVTDYLRDDDHQAERRALYLSTAARLLQQHMQDVNKEWQPGKKNYRAEFEAAPTREALRRILTGMIVLSGFETGGERLQAAYDSADQEDEHSCFSDNTHRDMIQDIQGILNVWNGRYSTAAGGVIEGVGMRQVAQQAAPQLAESINRNLQRSYDLANALQVPFDVEISAANTDGRERVLALIVSLRTLERSLMQLMQKLELALPEVQD